MTKRTLLISFGTAVLGVSLAALPAISGQTQSRQESTAALKKEIAELKAKLAEAQAMNFDAEPVIAGQTPEIDIDREVIQEPEAPAAPGMKKFVMSFDGDGTGWLGVETQEVSADKRWPVSTARL
jgi:hypothetical protein